MIKTAILGAALATALAGCATTTSPTGRNQYAAVSDAELNQLGAQAFAEYKAKLPQSTNATQTRYVQCVVNSIVNQLPTQYRNTGWETALFQNDQANAFALPGGKVGVYTGIFKVATNQDQLAAVVAHEIGHVVARHHNERVSRQMASQQLVNVLGAVVGSRYGEGAGQIAQVLGGAGAQGLFVLPNSRTQETEADVVGQQLMGKAGFDPRQAVNLWQNMISSQGSSRGPEWMSTHPDPANRITELRSRADGLVPTYQAAQKAGIRPRCG